MPGLYSFTIDARRSFVHMKLPGYFSPEDVCTFASDRREAYKALRCPAAFFSAVALAATVIFWLWSTNLDPSAPAT